MKKIIVTLFAVMFSLCMGTLSYAKSEGTATPGIYEFDGSFALASGPGDYDGGFGINFGAGYMLESIDRNLQARFDVSFYHFSHDFSWGTGTYNRVPLTISARYYIPFANKMRAFGQVGVETSVDNFDTSGNQSKSEVNLGISPGVGVEFFVNPKVSIFALGVAHLISDSYFSMQFGVATHF